MSSAPPGSAQPAHLTLQNSPEAESHKAIVHDIYIRKRELGVGKPGVLFPLSKVCSTVGPSSLPQGKTADEPKGAQDDGQEDAQEGEGVLRSPDPADRAASNDNDGTGTVPADVSTVDVADPGVVVG